MSGIYIHIPFCKSRCTYCDFHSCTSLDQKADILAAIEREIGQRASLIKSEAVQTLYIGGGTPSLCSIDEIKSLIECVHSNFCGSELTEVTMEANPDDLTAMYVKGVLDAGVNRLSIGIQSFIDRDLQQMNRRHSSSTARQAVAMAREAGCRNISIDLIYGLMQMSLDEWEYNIREALKLNIEHISAYHLTIEEQTPLGARVARGELQEIESEQSSDEFIMLQRLLCEAGYEHYEVSNFALPGYRAIHNSNYWNGTKYLGVGPSAHSYNGTERQWNISDNDLYLKHQPLGTQFESEILTIKSTYNEMIMTSLRTSEGIDSRLIKKRFGVPRLQYFERQVEKFVKSGVVERSGTTYHIKINNYLISDSIIAELFAD